LATQIIISCIEPFAATFGFHNIALATQITIGSIIPPIAARSFSNIIFTPLDYGIVPPSSALSLYNIALTSLARQAIYRINTATLLQRLILRIVAHRNAGTAAAAWASFKKYAVILQTSPYINSYAI
jgi:hypothetical protein